MHDRGRQPRYVVKSPVFGLVLDGELLRAPGRTKTLLVASGISEVAIVNRRPDKSAITKAGARLDADYEQRLADEAEAGFDPATLTRCWARDGCEALGRRFDSCRSHPPAPAPSAARAPTSPGQAEFGGGQAAGPGDRDHSEHERAATTAGSPGRIRCSSRFAATRQPTTTTSQLRAAPHPPVPTQPSPAPVRVRGWRGIHVGPLHRQRAADRADRHHLGTDQAGHRSGRAETRRRTHAGVRIFCTTCDARYADTTIGHKLPETLCAPHRGAQSCGRSSRSWSRSSWPCG